MSKQKKVVFFSQNYVYLKKVLDVFGFDYDLGEVEHKLFPDGESYQRIKDLSQVKNRNVIIIGGFIDNNAFLEVYDLACAVSKYGAKTLKIVAPYFAYSTMERAVKPGEIVTAKTRTRLISAIPQAKNGNQIFLFDLHSEGMPHYFGDNINVEHVYCEEVIKGACKDIAGVFPSDFYLMPKDYILASTDAGRAKWVESLANKLRINAAFVFKRRLSGSETQITSINANVVGKKVIIYDDMIRTGGSLISAAKAYKEAGAEEISVVTTHGVFAGNGFEKIKNSGLFKNIVSTDSHPNALNFQDSGLKVMTIAPLIIKALKNNKEI